MTSSGDYTIDILITGIQNDHGKCYTESLLFPTTVHCTSPFATVNTSVGMSFEEDDDLCRDCELAVSQKVHEYQTFQLHLVKIEKDPITSMGKEY